jgi:hypothetical protein
MMKSLAVCKQIKGIMDMSWWELGKHQEYHGKNLALYRISCASYVMTLWSAADYGAIHDFKVLPLAAKERVAPDHWPEAIGRFWVQAKSSLEQDNLDVAAVVARSALQTPSIISYNSQRCQTER